MFFFLLINILFFCTSISGALQNVECRFKSLGLKSAYAIKLCILFSRMISNQQWQDKCEATKQMAINELQDTLRLRESLFVARGRARNTLRAQTDVTNYMLRRRIYDTQRARNELDWQKMKVRSTRRSCPISNG